LGILPRINQPPQNLFSNSCVPLIFGAFDISPVVHSNVPPDTLGTPVVVFASGNYLEAQLVVCALEGHEIGALVLDDNICRLNPKFALIVGGAKVLVDLHDLKCATDVLKLVFNGEPPFAGRFFTIPLSLAAAIITMFRMWRKRKPAAELS
jgi:hypothetical protein